MSSLDYTQDYSPAQRLSAVSSMNGKSTPPEMKLELDGVQRTLTDESIGSAGDSPNNSLPKSPGGRWNLFGRKNSTQKGAAAESPSTTFSDRSPSSIPSPLLHTPIAMEPAAVSGTRLAPAGLDILKANAASPRREYFDNPETPILIGSPETNAHVKELERELAHVSSELASSVKREMELEDELDRMKTEAPSLQPYDGGRRTSDYFSDSGASSTRFPITDVDSKFEQMERSLRKVEQEKAQIKVEMASRLQTELSRRRDLEQMVQNMEEQLQRKFDEDDEHRDAEDRIDELESTLEDTRRLLSQERQAKGSFEDLYSATREELEQHRNERDNLRDEVVPSLKARVEGLETESSDTQALMYENTRMQQELAALKERMGGRFGSIAEEDGVMSPTYGGSRMGLSRSGSLARSQSKRGGSLTRNGSVKEREGGRHRSGSLGGDAVKEIEDQRDALHKALKLLIVRCDKQQKEHDRAIKKLTVAKTRAEQYTPQRNAYHREVSFLKEEVTTLRKRTEDALEQKWQYEKGLSGIKMDLDRSEMETRGLRIILQEHDILAPSTRTRLSESDDTNEAVDDRLKMSISTAEAERDQAREIAQQYRTRAQDVGSGDSGGAMELMNSASRMDELAGALDKQVQSNVQLRNRLADAVAKGEKTQRESNGRIAEMQKRLTIMEDSVLAAQQHSETTLGNHEAEVRRLEEASTPALQRLRISIPPEGKKLTPTASPLIAKSPKLNGKRLTETSLLEMSRTQMLERKVKEMEGLLREAEEDMHVVVQRVNKSQMEVAELQTERDAALMQMRKLQGLIVEERERVEGLMGGR